METDEQQGSQLASSRQEPSSNTPRPAKRRRTSTPRTLSTVICLDDDPPLSQVSPNKPPRPQKVLYHQPIFVISDSDEDEVVQIPVPLRSSGLSAKDNSVERKQKESSSLLASVMRRSDLNEIRTPTEMSPRRPNDGAASRSAPVGERLKVPDNFDFPSPPPSSSDECDDENPPDTGFKAEICAHSEDRMTGHEKPNLPFNVDHNRPQLRRVTDTNDPPFCSQDSSYFSFSRDPIPSSAYNISSLPQSGTSVKREPENLKPADEKEKKVPYYAKAFDYVITEVLARYRDLLRPLEVGLATSMKTELSRDALALFVRIYRRKQPQWYRTEHLHSSYGAEINVDAGVTELCAKGFVISSLHASKGGKKVTQLVARELLKSLRAPELKSVLSAVSDSGSLKKLSTRKLLPALQSILIDNSCRDKGRKRLRQGTLTGLSQGDCLSRAILKRAGHSLKIPEHVLEQLRRIHFLFFLEDGHDSPNVILADTGKAKFPNYECLRRERIFPSSYAFEDYESALVLELRMNNALELKDLAKATHYGSIAELEVREYVNQGTESTVIGETCAAQSCTENGRMGSVRSLRRKMLSMKETNMQLKHPFFRRYTAHWVHVRTAWHSVSALEKLGEYEIAVKRLRLLLSTGLMPRRRGKCINRLTINLFKHLGLLQEALEVILSALQEEAPILHFGDRIALANRGIAIHRKLALPLAEERARSIKNKSDRKKAAFAKVLRSRPSMLIQALSRTQVKINVRKIFGKSLQIAERERKRKADAIGREPWESFMINDSRDSMASTKSEDIGIFGKSKFASLGRRNDVVSVEEYCLEWYLGKEGWRGVHDEGCSLRFLYSLLFWDCALFAPVEDVFQTPYQDRPLDLFTEAFYESRRKQIDEQLRYISLLDSKTLRGEVLRLYGKHENTRAIGCAWNMLSGEDLSHIAAGLGGCVLAQCCRLLSQDYAYWGGGLPDLTMWKTQCLQDNETFDTRLVEVKSQRDSLSERQRAWLIELRSMEVDCEVCKVVEKVTDRNTAELESATLDSIEISAIDAAKSVRDSQS